mgnify:CR=1 FL=1
MPANDWSRDELLVSLQLYLRLPFGQLHAQNPAVRDLAQLIGRTPAAVAMRRTNYASLDQRHLQRGIRGLAHASRGCQQLWNDYLAQPEDILFESEEVLARAEGRSIAEKYPQNDDEHPQGCDARYNLKTRVNQHIFRTLVLANFQSRCVITGVNEPSLLVASHIVPWAAAPAHRLNPANGLPLLTLYDRCFDQGFLSIDAQGRWLVSAELPDRVGPAAWERFFAPVVGLELPPAAKYAPAPDLLAWHRNHCFR